LPEPAACGVDIGTTHIKAVLVGTGGELLSMAKAATPVTGDGFGSCHDPEQIRLTAEQVMCSAQGTAPGHPRIAAIGVTSVGEEGVPLGRGGELLYPSICWFERRPSSAERDWSLRHDSSELFSVTGLHKDLGFSLFKWLWLREARPDVWSACASWLGIGDYVTWRWTGQRGMSVSHASRTGILDLSGFRWRDDWAADVLANGPETLPPLHQAGSPVGILRPGVIPGLATTGEVPVVATGLDHTVGGYAAGVTERGQLLDSMGTAEGLIAPLTGADFSPAAFQAGVNFGAGIVPGTHIAIASLESGAGVSGIVRALGAPDGLEAQAARLDPGADGLTYVPPRFGSLRGGAFFGHKAGHSAPHMYRAVIEGWSLAADEALSALGSGDRPKDVVCVGGGSASALWLRVKASIAGREISCVTTPEVAAVGAALLADTVRGAGVGGVATGRRRVAPEPGWVAGYAALRGPFRRLTGILDQFVVPREESF
jgi:xylulokinase